MHLIMGRRLVIVVAIMALCLFGCYGVLAATSRCGFLAQWAALTRGAPQVPLPLESTRLSIRVMPERPSESAGGSAMRAYSELYWSRQDSAELVGFYHRMGAVCS